MHSSMTQVYLSLGSNLGDRAGNIARAVQALPAHGVRVVRESSLYETEPLEIDSEGWFLNSVVEAETDHPPLQLMHALLEIERSLGRNRPLVAAGAKQSRTIDIDILLAAATILRTPELEIPHPRMAERRFVLVPLVEIAPGTRHPALRKTIAELLDATTDRSQVRLLHS